MTLPHADEIAANLERAEQSIQAARQLASGGYYDFAASRAYYAAFYAATAVLLSEESEFSKHSAVIAFIHQRYVKTGKLSKEQGKSLNWLFELRSEDNPILKLRPEQLSVAQFVSLTKWIEETLVVSK